MTQIIGSIINDCSDDNARSRQELRFKSLFGVQPTFIGVGGEAPGLEAAGFLVDQLDALGRLPASRQESAAVILVNVAPRGGKTKEIGDNGTPFCYFRVGKALVVSAFAGECLSLVKKLGIVDEVELLDVPTVTADAVSWGELTTQQAERINHSQFRSLEFLPLVAYWLCTRKPVPSAKQRLKFGPNKGQVWFVDNFGNAKTMLLPKDVGFVKGRKITLADGATVTCYRRLTDVPKDQSALTIGSSGYKDDRFLEVVVQWRDNGFNGSSSAKDRHGLRPGSHLLQ